ncbi:MAG: hypothetical protein ACOCNF_06905 [Prevotella pectinovora]
MISLDNLRTVLNAIKRTLDSTKQDKLIAGKNITIAADGKTISAINCSDKILSVTITGYTDAEIVADKTYAEIKAAIDSGYPIHTIDNNGNTFVPRVNFESAVQRITLAWTERLDSTTWVEIIYEVNTQNSWGVTIREYVDPDEIGALTALDTSVKDNLVAAINVVKHIADGKQDKLIAGDNITISADGKTISAAGGGPTVELDTTLSKAGKAADAKAVGDALAGKQGTISDLATIRSGAAKGATALQSVPSTYRTAAAQDKIDNKKVDKVTGKGLSTNDYTNAAKAKVDAIPANPKYTDTVYDDTALKERVATIEGKEASWDAKSNFSGNYNDLTNKPTIPTALPNPNALTIKIGSTTVTYDGSTAQTVTIADGTEVSY